MSLPLPLFLRLNHSYQICGYCLRSPSTKTLPEGVLGFDGGDGGGIRIIAQPHPTASERRWILFACLRSDRFDSIRFDFARSSEEKPLCGRAVGWLAGWLAGCHQRLWWWWWWRWRLDLIQSSSPNFPALVTICGIFAWSFTSWRSVKWRNLCLRSAIGRSVVYLLFSE
jgi:hypothetical protein